MPLPVTRQATSLATQVPDSFSRTEGKQLSRLQNAEIARGLIVSTRIQAAALAAGVGMQCAGMLSREAQFQADGDPAISQRVNFILDRYTEFVGNELARFGL